MDSDESAYLTTTTGKPMADARQGELPPNEMEDPMRWRTRPIQQHRKPMADAEQGELPPHEMEEAGAALAGALGGLRTIFAGVVPPEGMSPG